jgi:uncharacterized protein (DUF433 family)
MEKEHFEGFDRITQNPAIMGGKPCVRGMRVTVGMIVGQIGAGVSVEELLNDYPYLEREDIMQALQYAAALAQWREVVLTNDIEEGAMVTVDPRRVRVHLLPIVN